MTMPGNTIQDRLRSTAIAPGVHKDRVDMVNRYLEALNNADLEAISKMFAQNAIVLDPLGGTPVVGLASIRRFFAQGPFCHEITADLEGQIRIAGDSAAFAMVAYSQGLRMDIIDIFEFDRYGKIKKMTAYWSEKNVSKAPSARDLRT